MIQILMHVFLLRILGKICLICPFPTTSLLQYFYAIKNFREKKIKTRVIGCPKTIDGDLKCKEVPTSFGFDTACKVILSCNCYV